MLLHCSNSELGYTDNVMTELSAYSIALQCYHFTGKDLRRIFWLLLFSHNFLNFDAYENDRYKRLSNFTLRYMYNKFVHFVNLYLVNFENRLHELWKLHLLEESVWILVIFRPKFSLHPTMWQVENYASKLFVFIWSITAKCPYWNISIFKFQYSRSFVYLF